MWHFLFLNYRTSRDHEIRNAWLGPSFPLDLSTLPVESESIPLQYPSLSQSQAPSISGTRTSDCFTELGYSSEKPPLSLEARKKLGATVERILEGEKEAARAPQDLTF